tara:strand:+ start:400 stop:540 length:141 start_codon:yes stop_codon:yes gene_type:complete
MEKEKNKIEMIELCNSMIKIYSSSNDVFSPINKAIWMKKLNYWQLA